ncbi:DUF2779 domain-containing protein [archaeon CG10_big_fil_rev_8_21_14_0_10_43_11]|nr:MAG: DUF2779 domain-containing protein [archaeon CG10_big_fil_rev_8_21_14_0_10_43_11]
MKKYFTKKDYITGLVCSRSLWARYHAPEHLQTSSSMHYAAEAGITVGRLAKKLFAHGIDLEPLSFTENLAKSKEYKNARKTLFEAAFTYQSCYARADVLIPVEDKLWDIVEVKSASNLKDDFLHDLAFQKYCYEGAGLLIRKCFVLYINNEYVRKGTLDLEALLKKEDVTKKVMLKSENIAQKIARMQELITYDTVNDIAPRECMQPSACLAPVLCWGVLEKNNVFELARAGAKARRFYDEGVMRIQDIPDHFPLSAYQEIQMRATKQGREHLNVPELKTFMDPLTYPLYFLDFESFSTAIPLYDGTRPFQHIPFQFSLHIIPAPGAEAEHISFLAKDARDPREAFARALSQAVGTSGSIVVYNETYEKGRLKELKEAFPPYKPVIEPILSRIIDLEFPFRKFHYYHPSQQGRSSIKKVLPTLTKKSYDALAIAQGLDASNEFVRAVHHDTPKEEQETIFSQLEAYCALDTHAMIDLLFALQKKISAHE